MKKVILTSTFALLLPIAAEAQTTYAIAELSTANCAVSGISDYSDVAGQCNAVATLWSNGAATTLGKLANGTYSLAQSSNVSRVAVGNGDAGDGRPRAELFRNATTASSPASSPSPMSRRVATRCGPGTSATSLKRRRSFPERSPSPGRPRPPASYA